MKTSNYERIAADAYMTPKWCVESLLGKWTPRSVVIDEPACGTGNIVTVLRDYGYKVTASDINDYGDNLVEDFLIGGLDDFCIITNPPYTLIKEFISRALENTKKERGQVAFLLRHEWDAPKSHRQYLQWPFAHKFILPKRPIWFPDEPLLASPRFPYAWYVWDWQYNGPAPTIGWLD